MSPELLSGTLAPGNAGSFIGNVVSGAVTNAVVQGIAVATGLQDKFDWAGVAAAGIAHGVNTSVSAKGLFGIKPTAGSFGSRALSGAASAIASAATRSAISGDSFGDSLRLQLPSLIGQLAGTALGEQFDGRSGGEASGGPARKSGGVLGTIEDALTFPGRVAATVGRTVADVVTSVGDAVGDVFNSIVHSDSDRSGSGPATSPTDSLMGPGWVEKDGMLINQGAIREASGSLLDDPKYSLTASLLAELGAVARVGGFVFSASKTNDFGAYDDTPPDWLTKFRRDNPEFVRAENKLWSDSQDTSSIELALDIPPFRRTGHPAREHALLVWRNTKTRELDMKVFKASWDTPDRIEFPDWIASRPGWTLIIAEHTHPFPYRFAPKATGGGYVRGPSGIPGDQQSIQEMGRVARAHGQLTPPIAIIRAAGHTSNPGAVENWYFGTEIHTPR